MTKRSKAQRLQALRQKLINILDQKTGREKAILRATIRELERLIRQAKNS